MTDTTVNKANIGLKIIDFLTLFTKGVRQINSTEQLAKILAEYPALSEEDVEGHWKSWAFKLDDFIRIYFKDQALRGEAGFDDSPNTDFYDLPFYQRVSTYWTSRVFGEEVDQFWICHIEDVEETINYIKKSS